MKRHFTLIFIIMLVMTTIVPISPANVTHATTGPINLGFKPNDTALDPTRPVLYMTRLGDNTIYAANYETGEIKTLKLEYSAEKLELYNDYLYVTQQKTSHDYYHKGPYSGAIAEVNTENFTLDKLIDVNIDPYDIAISDDGYIYITPGSGQSQSIKAYSLEDKTEVSNTSTAAKADIGSRSYYSSHHSKVYTISSAYSPIEIYSYEVKNGVVQAKYDSPYHGEYQVSIGARLSPDGLNMYNNNGVVFSLTKLFSVTYNFNLGRSYNDFAFSLDKQLTFGANSDGGIDVYKYNKNEYLYTLYEDGIVQNLYYRNGLITVYSDDNGQYYLNFLSKVEPEPGPIFLGFKPNDVALDPKRPIVYMTKPGSRTIYAANYETGVMKTLQLLYPDSAKRLELYNDKLYVTQEYFPSISEINTENFTLNGDMGNIFGDSYDIAISDDGFIYNTPIIGDREEHRGFASVYSFAGKTEIFNETSAANIYKDSNIYYSSATSKVYTISSSRVPSKITALGIKDGVIKTQYDSPYLGDYNIFAGARISPDGLNMYNNSGIVFSLSSLQSSDMKFKFDLGQTYNDYAFSLDKQLTFGANSAGGIDVYKINTDEYIYSLYESGIVQNLFYKNGLIKIYSDENGEYYLDFKRTVEPVNHNIVPSVKLIPNITTDTKQNVNIKVRVRDDNVIKSITITLPSGEKVTTSSTTYTVNKNGTYLFEIEDLAGNVVKESIIINNIDKILPKLSLQPSTTAPTRNDLIVVAKSSDNVKVKAIKLPNGTIINGTSASFRIGKNGTYSFRVEDVAGNTVTKSIVVTNIDKIAPANPTINKITSKTTAITGKAEKGTTVYIYNGSKLLNKGIADSKGNFKITIKPQKKGSTLKIKAVDKVKNISKYTTVLVK